MVTKGYADVAERAAQYARRIMDLERALRDVIHECEQSGVANRTGNPYKRSTPLGAALGRARDLLGKRYV